MDHAFQPEATYRVARPPLWRGGLIVASPHSGAAYPDWFVAESPLSLAALRSSEDAFVDRLALRAQALGAVVLTARLPRALVDLNRAPDEFDPRIVAGFPLAAASARARSGLGVIPRIVGQGRAIRSAPLTLDEAQARVAAYWHPYHAALAALMDEATARFGRAVLVDLHSMPRDALAHLARPLPDVVIGDLHGRSAGREIRAAVATALAGAGLRLRLNAPFSGAHILTRHGDPGRGRHAVQVEIDRALYMNEARIEPHDGLAALGARLERAFATLLAALDDQSAAPFAAE